MSDIGSLLNRPKIYYNIDGVGEFGMGFGCLGFALLLWLQVHTPKEAIWHQMYVFLAYVGMMWLAIHYGSKAIKKHITYPRTGFVEYRTRDRVWTAIAAAVLAPAVIALIVFVNRRHWDVTTLASLAGLIFAAAYGYVARTVRWKWAVAAAMALGSLMIAFLPENLIGALTDESMVTRVMPARLERAFLLSILLYGALWLISGGISFWLYLRHTQAAAQDAQ